MLMTIAEIRYNGAVLHSLVNADDKTRYWLPAQEWGYDSAPEWNEQEKDKTWEKARNRLDVGAELDVVLVPGRLYDKGLQVVSTRRVTVHDMDDSCGYVPRDMRIMDVSRDFIKGRIGNASVVVRRQEYTDFLDRIAYNDFLKDHGALAAGDFLSVVILGRATPNMLSAEWVVPHLRVNEGWLRAGFQESMVFLEKDVENHSRKGVEGPTAARNQVPQEGIIAAEYQRKRDPEQLALLSPLLLVEDNEACRTSWAAALRSARIVVTVASNLAKAKEIVCSRASEFSVALIDIHLENEGAVPDEHDGIELAKRLRNMAPNCRIILTSGQEVTPALVREWGHVAVHGYLSKPCLASDLLPYLEAAAALDAPKPLREWWAHEERQTDALRIPSAPSESRKITIKDAFTEFSRARPGMVIHVFRVHPRSWRGTSMAHLGHGLNWAPFQEKLGKSIIRDAACQDAPVLDNQCSDGDGRHLWTRQMMKYGSFWGKRLEAPGPYRYVLAVFHLEREVFDEVLCLKALVCAERVTRVIAKDQLLRRGQHDAEYIAAGLGFGCLAHEIYADLTGMDEAVALIAQTLSGVETSAPDALDTARAMADLLVRTVPDLVRSARILRGRAGGSEPISVEYCLEKAAQVARRALREAAQSQKDILVEAPAPSPQDACLVNAVPSALVTLFFNVFLNAAQQIGFMRCVRKEGRVWASVERYEDDRAKPWAVVRIHDTGPGIHPEDWESIFDPGHTTKHEGTGLGLHICRQLLGNIKEAGRSATIEVTRSAVWGGTTFAIRLPLAQ